MVVGRRSMSSSVTGCDVLIEVPRSPRSRPAEVVDELDGDRLVEAVGVVEGGARCRWARSPRTAGTDAAGQQAAQDEDEDDDPDQDRDREEDAAEDVAESCRVRLEVPGDVEGGAAGRDAPFVFSVRG